MELDRYLSERLEELKGERISTIESLELIRDKITRADTKRGAQPETEHYHKWSLILRGLESDLDKAKILLTSIEAEIAEKSEKLSEFKRKETEEREYRETRLQEILNMNPDELAALPLEDMALLQDYELSLVDDSPPTPDEDAPEVSAGDAPVAEEAPPVAPEEPLGEEDASSEDESQSSDRGDGVARISDDDRRTFGKVLTKHATGLLNEITFHEYETFMRISTMILQNPADDNRSVRVKDMTSAALREGGEECTRLLEIMSEVFAKDDLDRAAS